jgi:serine phosphatase RsbU (regulator of sigma subunit)
VALIARGRALGMLTLARSNRRFEQADVLTIDALSKRAALSIDNAVLYERERTVARTLQRELAPPALFHPPGYEVSARYRAYGEGLDVGGDFYDLFACDGEHWIAAVGDVVGHGPEAAARTGLVRHTLRAVADPLDLPATLRMISEAIEAEREDWFCTLAILCGRADTPGVLTYCRAGHPPAVIRRKNGDIDVPRAAGALLGAGMHTGAEPRTIRLEPGDCAVLLTDGVTEAGIAARQLGLQGVTQTIRDCAPSTASAIADALVDAAVRHSPAGDLSDDVAVLALALKA